jgi:predicted O-methyltransferase YrrM
MKFWHRLPLFRNYVAALSRVSALETAFALMLENPRYVASDAAGFNGQHHRKRIFRELVEACTFDRLIETGTYIGDTTAFMATTTGLPVHTCEANRTFQALARSRVAGIAGIHFHTGDSRQCLRSLLSDPASKSWVHRPLFFYLDAHWHADLPLVEEIALIASYAKDFVIMIDDFRVEGDPGYGYDDYGRDRSLELSTLRSVLDRFGLQSYFPRLPAVEESGGRRGCVVLCPAGDRSTRLDRLDSLRPIGRSS